ncbi:sulfur carrier protein ThiS [bacterium]|nr:sulfur carrier protein ThiS [bacterium]MCB1220111.1 sulfur carrier protein ThiS [bacterium]UNM07773.1 MAG: sulfur carrier protein ThiS [Planctomycetales bacterium]
MISLTVNGRNLQFDEELSGSQLLEKLDRNAKTLVIEHNGKIIPVAEFLESMVRDGDELELVTLVGGG